VRDLLHSVRATRFEGEGVRQIRARLEEAGIEVETPVDASAAESGPA